MKKIIVLLFASFSSLFAQEEKTRAVHFGIIYPISSNGSEASKYSNNVSLHAISGVSKNERVLTISGVGSLIKENASGFQMAGVFNQIGNNSSGFQMAGVSNYTKNDSKGLQMAGVFNGATSANTQISGFMNKSGNINGAQVAGFINVAKKVKGVQIAGFINIADSSDYPIGIVNIVKNGEKSLGVSYDEVGTALLTFRSGGRVLYGILGLGYNFNNRRLNDYYALETGIGAHLIRSPYFRLNAEVYTQSLYAFKDKNAYQKYGIRVLPSYRFGERFEIFAGPSVNFVNYKTEDHTNLSERYIWKDVKYDHFKGFNLGFTAGVSVKF